MNKTTTGHLDESVEPLLGSVNAPFNQRRRKFRPVRIAFFAIPLLMLFIAYEVCQWELYKDEPAREIAFDVRVVLHVPLFVCTFLYDRILAWVYNRTRNDGYLDFWRRTGPWRKFPFVLASFVNAAILLLFSISAISTRDESYVVREKILQGIATAELVVMVLTTGYLWYRTHQFNTFKPMPDSFDEVINPPALRNTHSVYGEALSNDVMVRQADTIRHLEEQRALISKKLLSAEHKLSEYAGIGATTSVESGSYKRASVASGLGAEPTEVIQQQAKRIRQLEELLSDEGTKLQQARQELVTHRAETAGIIERLTQDLAQREDFSAV